VRPVWALSCEVKVLIGEGSSNCSLTQGCPSRGRIRRKRAANLRPEDHEPQVRLATGKTSQIALTPKRDGIIQSKGMNKIKLRHKVIHVAMRVFVMD
jgi:hypothetical protein